MIEYTRHEFSRRTKGWIWGRARGCCEKCGIDVTNRVHHFDHIEPDWISGRDDMNNGQLLCVQCHKDKTKKDKAIIAKSKRIIDKRSGALTSRNIIPGSKRSPWKHKMRGGWERR